MHCEVCGFSFEEHYGSMGHGYIEAHHKLPFTDNDFYGETKMDDLVLVCSNCHRMLHRGDIPLSVSELKELVKS
ncbi:MAG: HNH endonuclease [Hyphomicrobiales bacterium]